MVRVPGEICWYVKKKKKWEGPNITARTGSDKFDERATKAENL